MKSLRSVLHLIVVFAHPKKLVVNGSRTKNKPVIVTVPEANYIAVRGKGNPNEEGGAYQQAIGVLYAIAYTLRMSYKTIIKLKDSLNM